MFKIRINSSLLLVFLLVPPPPLAAQEISTLTFLEGVLRVIRGTTVLQGAEGARLRQGDIIESSTPGFAQLEFAGGTTVALGASSRLFLFNYSRGNRGGKADTAQLVLLSGWLKGETAVSGGAYRYASPLLAAATNDGTVVMHATAQETEIFIESGSANIAEVSPNGNWGQSVRAKVGQFLSRSAGKNVTNSARPTSTFIESVPRPFRDTLPSRLSRFEKPVELRRDHEVTYSEIESWLNIGQTWRKGFVERFKPRLKNAEFRRAVEAHLNNHPEWDSVLHPEKRPPTPVPAHDTDSPDGRYPR
jgi:hypothetical protein